MKGFGERETMSLSACSSSYASSVNRREAKLDDKRAEFIAPDSSCFIDDILRQNFKHHEDLTD